MRRNPTVPLPDSFDEAEPGLMTLAEFLRFRDPEDKYHPSTAYAASIETLNRSARWNTVGRWEDTRRGRKIRVYAYRHNERDEWDDNLVFEDASTDKVTGVLHDGVLYKTRHQKIPDWYESFRGYGDPVVNLRPNEVREVKYPEEYVYLVYDPRAENRERYPVLLQRIALDGEAFQLRAERVPRQDKRDTVVIMNDDDMVVAMGSDEWGATLLRVAEELRGRGLGRLLASVWYEYNPRSTSGGFTAAGRANAKAAWADRVREFMARGWYSEMVRSGLLSKKRADAIVVGLSGLRRSSSTSRIPEPRGPEPRPVMRVFVDDDGIAFVLYDARFLDEPDEKYVHGYGLLRDTDTYGMFFYRLEHDREYAQLVTMIGLQMVRSYWGNNESVYVADVPGDMIEIDALPGVEHDDGYVRLVDDFIDIKRLAAEERAARKPVDPYGQLRGTLLETAENKWR